MILDTTFIIDFFCGRREAVAKMEELESGGGPILTTGISVYETAQGLKTQRESETAKEFFSNFMVLPLTRKSAWKAAIIQKKLRKAGLTIQDEDAMIAGIALSRNHAVLTRNTKDFSRVTGLKVETY